MTDVFSKICLTSPLDPGGVRRLSRHACLDIHRVRWLRSYLAMEGAQMLCWYQAPDAESVRLVLRQQGTPETTVWPAEVGCIVEREPLDEGREMTLVELALEPSGSGSTRRAALAALADAGASLRPRVAGSFASSTIRTRPP